MYYSSNFYIFDDKKPRECKVRNYQKEDFAELINIQAECFPPPFPTELWWSKDQLENHVTIFPEGAICVEVEGKLAGSLTSLCIAYNEEEHEHTWSEITADGYITTHSKDGNALYVVDISIRPAYRSLGLGKIMMQAMYQIVIDKKLDRLIGGGRMPGYRKYADELSPEEYVSQVVAGEKKDPVITFLMSCGRMPVCVLNDYLEDEDSLNHVVLMEWKNPFK
ncbi:GNAT family N-acetyltransferase [Niallia taxi]|uniref:GNAT family N-acetyltransferase n=1 Tax=Niallia taxi TaxID=2499688 RepID=UPI002E1BAD29|nr:GNAT family N-acetyltransferase [Niallia taxi]MED4052566.1 GNAT family N-acetyltransferase [Niallia taxi]MED4119921.1 GNAT family N-acetyltransferase [Niallia taxi]